MTGPEGKEAGLGREGGKRKVWIGEGGPRAGCRLLKCCTRRDQLKCWY